MSPNLPHFLLLLFYLIILGIAAKLIVDNSVILARRLGVSDLFIGLTVIAFGTDLPELFLAISGALHTIQGHDSSGLIIGNAIGSSITQISFVIGLTALFHYLSIGKLQVKLLGAELFGSGILLLLIGFDGIVSRIEGITLILAFGIYLFYAFYKRKEEKAPVEDQKKSVLGNMGWIVLGFIFLIWSSQMAIDKALYLSQIWGLQQSFVGAIIIGLGTSLPELVISITAILQHKPNLSIGNIIGSNIFDLLIPVGVAATITPLSFPKNDLWFDLPFLTGLTILVIWLLQRVKGLQKNEGIILMLVYLTYVLVKYFLSQ